MPWATVCSHIGRTCWIDNNFLAKTDDLLGGLQPVCINGSLAGWAAVYSQRWKLIACCRAGCSLLAKMDNLLSGQWPTRKDGWLNSLSQIWTVKYNIRSQYSQTSDCSPGLWILVPSLYIINWPIQRVYYKATYIHCSVTHYPTAPCNIIERIGGDLCHQDVA